MNFSPMELVYVPLNEFLYLANTYINLTRIKKRLAHYFPTGNYTSIYIKCMEGQKRTADPNTFNLLKQMTYLNYKEDLLT